MTTERALLEGIRAAPADDAPRLVYADWLDDRGGPGDADRAAFIRVQCRLAGLTEDDPEYEDLVERQGELLARHRDAWLAPLPASARAARHVFRRGFVDEVEVSAAAFCKDGGRLLDRTPLGWLALSHSLRGDGWDGREFAACSHLASVRGLRVPTFRAETCLGELLASPHLTSLTHLDLGACYPGRADFTALSRARWLDRLEFLDLSSVGESDWWVGQFVRKADLTSLCELVLTGDTYNHRRPCGKTAGGLGELLAQSRMRRLRRLDLNGRHIDNSGLACLAGWPGLASVEELGLGSTRLVAGALKPLVRSEYAGNVTGLNLTQTQVADADLIDLAASPILRRLERLDVSAGSAVGQPGGTGIAALLDSRPSLRDLHAASLALDDAAARRLAGRPGLGRLRRLSLPCNHIEDDGVAALAASPHASGLLSLSLASNPVGTRGIAALAGSDRLTNLRRLDLFHIPLPLPAVRALLRASWMPQITHLDLSFCSMSSAAVRLLATSPAVGNLRSLDLSANPVDVAAVQALAASPHLGRLRQLWLFGIPCADEGAAAVAGSATFARLQSLNLRNTRMTATGATALAASPYLGGLEDLQVSDVEDRAATRALRARYGARVTFD